ncbi:oxidoreductase [Peziza echinospora]|nr:oxidoreductase [Peziza echinospora]
MSATKALAIIAGAGPGTGSAIAARFGKAYTVVLLARTPASFSQAVEEINAAGGDAHGIPVDVSDIGSLNTAFQEIATKYPGREVRAGIFNLSARPKRGSFLDLTPEDHANGFETPSRSAFNFAQKILPLLLSSAKSTDATGENSTKHHPTLIFSGATASVKAGALFSNFAPSKFALRALSQSLAKEFQPKGVHVSHAVIDGVIDTPFTKTYFVDKGPDAKLSPDAIAEEYWHLHTQHRSVWTWEIDVRPWVENW